MCKVVRRFVAAFFVILMLVTLFPFQVFAVDPVSAATMANALAQALTAYGASHGVSMMFDVSDTSGIGEGLHDLWEQFKSDINDNDVPTYDSLAITIWANLYKKVRDSVAINVSAENVGYFDQFWNWLLSGPAEMTRVDNQYYTWTLNQNNNVDPITVYRFNLFPFVPVTTRSNASVRNSGIRFYSTSNADYYIGSSIDGFYLFYIDYQNGLYRLYYITELTSGQCYTATNNNNSVSDAYSNWLTNNPSVYFGGYYGNFQVDASTMLNASIPVFTSLSDAYSTFYGRESYESNIAVQPYIGDTAPQDVYIPDNDDVNYQPLPYVGPLDIPWQNAWGDGETVTDAIGTSIAGALDDAIVDGGTLELESDNTSNPPIDDVIGGPDDYQVPGLADVFPFCIPFDIYHFLQALAADPTPPHFTATLAFPEAVGGSQQIEIDFDTPTFNQIAAILRTMELLAFCIGLALLTRSMFIRG